MAFSIKFYEIWILNSKHYGLLSKESLPQFVAAPPFANRSYPALAISNCRFYYWKFPFLYEMKKTEERPDYCQHFIYMKVLQKAVKKIAWGFPQLLLTTAWRGKHKKMS